MAENGSTGTLGDLLAARRRRRFVGRVGEIELFRMVLHSVEPLLSLLYVHGPAGIGKTTLLDVYAEAATDAGASVVRIDGRELVPAVPMVLEALRGVLGLPEETGPIVGRPGTGRLVLLIDTWSDGSSRSCRASSIGGRWRCARSPG